MSAAKPPFQFHAILSINADGLIERHGESLDEGLERLRTAAAGASGDLEETMAAILDQVREPQSVDDTAMTGVKWASQNQG